MVLEENDVTFLASFVSSPADVSLHNEGAPGRMTIPPDFEMQGRQPQLSKLSGDPWVRVACALFFIGSLPYFLPILTTDQLWYYGGFFFDLPLVALIVLILATNFSGTTKSHHRRFWRWLILGFSLWIVHSVLGIIFVNRVDFVTEVDLASYFLYFAFYASVVMALECRPHRQPERSHQLLLVFDRLGALVFLFGLLLYLTVVPALIDWDSYWTSTLFLFAVLDVFIVVRLFAFRRAVIDEGWRRVYSWFLAAAVLWFLSDFAEVLMWSEILPYIDSGTPYDILWLVALPVFAVAVRAGWYAQSSEEAPSKAGHHEAPWEALGMAPVVVYAVALPLFHLVFYRLGWADPALKSLRELVTVVVAIVLAAMAYAYQQWLRRENEQLAKQRVRAQDRLEHQAFHDALTGLPNRFLFREHLKVATSLAQRHEKKCAVLYCDLDDFKIINDSLGHETGDEFLVGIARRLRDSIRASDTVARLGGDEFAILVHDINASLEVLPVAQHLITALKEPVRMGDREHSFGASIGIALYPDDGTDEASLLRHADIAMYQAKLKGGNAYQLFTPSMNEAVERRVAIERALQTALDEGQFEMLYQPIIDIGSRKAIGCEALLRWNHPDEGQVSPDFFIDVAEKTGLIVPIGAWALEAACQWAQDLEAPGLQDFLIAVNISPSQLQHPDFLSTVRECIQRTGITPSRLQLEISESMAIESDNSFEVIAALRDIGVGIAIDDLGTGFSGLSRLRDLPIDVVKIDQSFIVKAHLDPTGEAIAGAIAAMARVLDLQVVAEGVETNDQLEVVQRQGCHAVQGFFFHEPLSAHEVERLITPGTTVPAKPRGEEDHRGRQRGTAGLLERPS